MNWKLYSDVAGEDSLVMLFMKIVQPSSEMLYCSSFSAVLIAALSSKKLRLEPEKHTAGCVADADWSFRLKYSRDPFLVHLTGDRLCT